MTAFKCKDIFNAVYNNVKGVYVSNFYSSKVQTKTLNENLTEDETLQMDSTDVPKSEMNTNTREVEGSKTQTVKESIQRDGEAKTMASIRIELEDKFPFAHGSVCSNLAQLDRKYRALKGYDEQQAFSECFIDVTEDFPLCDRFVFSCIMYISSILLIDVDEKKSDDFYEKYVSAVTEIISEIPCTLNSIVEKYPY